MNADVRRHLTEIEPCLLAVPEAALARLRLRLGRAVATGEALNASVTYGASFDVLSELADYWLEDFDLDGQALFDLPMFTTQLDQNQWCFAHARSPETFALPLLLLHGYSGSLAELEQVTADLADPRRHAASPGDAFHVVCPALPGFGLSDPAPSAGAIAEGCAELMQRLGYSRYVVHGSDLGANLALALAAVDSTHVAGLHVTALPSYPSQALDQVASLTRHEKSQLALLTELHEELSFQLPESPLEQLAFALARLEHGEKIDQQTRWREPLLAGLTLSWALGNTHARNDLYRQQRLAAAPATTTPVSVHSFPLDAPSLRRFAELRHRVVDWTEHARGGSMPALEQPELLVRSLRDFFRRFR